jgi:hypothetical protein
MKLKTSDFSCRSIRLSVGRWMSFTGVFLSEGFRSFFSTESGEVLCKLSLLRTSANVPVIGVVAGDC